jgi:hypothetical protein
MARPEKRRIDSGEESTGSSRTTPKGTKPGAKPGSSSPSRYTPPTVSAFDQPSPMWVPIVMFSLLGAGFPRDHPQLHRDPPGHSPSGWYLLGGLVGILAGIVTATQLH